MSPEAILPAEEAPAPSTPGALVTELPALTALGRAALLFLGEGVSTGLGLGFVQLRDRLPPYLAQNKLWPVTRMLLLGQGIAAAGILVALALALAIVRRRTTKIPVTLLHVARRAAPLGLWGFFPLSFNWRVWQGKDLVYLSFVGLAVLVGTAAFRTAIDAGPLFAESRVSRFLAGLPGRAASRAPRLLAALPTLLVVAGAAAYAAYFSYFTVAWHRSVRSGYDLALESNLIWNVLHGGQFFKTSPLVGPTGSHFGYHGTLFAFVIAPIYALAPRAETLLVLQSTLLGFAAVPLYFFSRLHLSRWLACVLSLAYLLYPGVHGANLYEFHYLPLGTFFLWLSLYALEAKKDVLAVFAVLLTLSVREDVSAALAIWGAYLLLTGRRPVAGLVVSLVSITYFVTLKMIVMPRFAQAGQESFTFIYQKLLPQGENSFGAVLKTVFGNPWYTAGTLLEESKLVYVLQIFVPLAFIPLRRPLSLLFMLPGILFTLLSTGYAPVVSIHYQYTAHWTTFLFVATALTLERLDTTRRLASTLALVFAVFACSYQYGAVLQHNTSYGGPIQYKLGMDAEGRHRREALDQLLTHLPKDAKVSCSGFTTPQVTSRPDAYSMTLGVYDAEYLLFPSERADFIVNERDTVTRLLSTGEFGIVAVVPPFALAKRGADRAENAAFLARIR